MSTTTINKYPFFENNQVLTSTQLNELSGYLDQQTRMTRYRLIGIGCVCGLNPSYDSVTNKLTITEGTGVTSEGYLLETGKCEFTKYRAYTLPLSVDYPPFINPATQQQVTMWELLPASYSPLPSEIVQNLDLTFVNGATPGQKKVAMLFLECVDVDNDSCLGKSCDSFGAERTMTLRKLLVSIDDLKIIIANTGSTDLTYTAQFDLPDLLSTKPLFNPLLGHSKDYFQFSQNFKTAAASVYKRVASDPKDLLNVFRQTYTIFEPILKDTYNNTNPFQDALIPNLNIWNEIMDGVNSATNGPSYFGIQYFYDFLRDLLLAYNEFRDAAFELMSDCCFNTDLFPKHLLLGEAIVVDPDKPSQYRNNFVSIPLTPEQRAAKATVIAYNVRMVLMLRKFDVAIVHNPSTTTPPVTRITPSFEKWGRLSQRSIPFYYKIDDADPQLGTLERVWNYENVLRNKDKAGQYPVVAYGNQNVNQGAPISPVETPLYYDQDQFTFLRAEGFLRKPYSTVLTELEDIKHAFDLPFNVVAVRLQGTATPDEILERCNFSDLRSQYTANRSEFLCKMNRFFDHFFLTVGQEPKVFYVIKPYPGFVNALYATIATPAGGGNSSAAFLPPYYALPGSPLPRFAPPFQYAPIATGTLLNELQQNLNLLMERLATLCKSPDLLPAELGEFEYGADTTDINVSFIGTYIEVISLANLCKAYFNQINDQITHSTRNRYQPEMYFAYCNWIQEQLYFLNELTTDCKFRQLESIYYTLQYRIGYMQTNDPTLFSNFISRNPGVEHQAGVKYGGTLVVVYPGAPLNFTIKTRNVIAAQFQEIKNLEVRKSLLRATRGRSVAQTAELQLVEAQLCDLYAQQVNSTPRPLTLGAAVSAVSVRRIAIREDDVIADFSLPYLTNCNCECDDIPAPTETQLNLPTIAMPAFYDYNVGDFAFAKDVLAHTTGCTTPAQIQIDVRPHIQYGTGQAADNMLVLKFVVNGATPVTDFDSKTRTVSSITTAQGGTALISQASGSYQVITYTPPRNFLGVDTFEYVFEIYSFQSNVLLRSNKATVVVDVHNRCSVPGISTAQQPAEPINPA